MKINIILFFLCLVFPFFTLAQKIRVLDQNDQHPIPGVSILSESPRAFTYTNERGEADLSPFLSSERIEIICQGYESVYISINDLAKNAYEVYLKPSNISLEEVFISATRWQEASGNVPQRIISISPKLVELHNPQTSADLLGLSGKVFIQKSQQGGGSPMIRGFATNRLIYSVDGVRMNTAIFRAGNIQNVINLDPFATENTEVIFGPGSVMYGSDAIGGVMSFQTLRTQFSEVDSLQTHGKASIRYSSVNQEKSMHAHHVLSWKRWSLVSSISAWDFDHLRQGSHGPDDYIKDRYVQRTENGDDIIYQDDPLLQIPSAYSQYNLMQKLAFRPNKYWKLEYALHYSETSPYGRYDRHNRVRRGLPRYAEWSYGPQIWGMQLLSIEHQRKTKAFDLMSAKFARQRFEESRIDRNLNDSMRNLQTEKVIAWSVNLDFSKSTGKRNTLYYGAEAVLNDVNSTGEIQNILNSDVQLGPSRYPQATWSTASLYMNNEFRMNRKWTLQGGFRYAYYGLSADFDTSFYPFPFTSAQLDKGALTGSAGAVYRPGKNWIVRANMSTAFRSPNVDDMGKVFDSEPGAVTIPNPSLAAEYAWNADISVAKVFSDLFKMEVSVFYTYLDHALVRRNATLNGLDSILYQGQLSQVQSIQNAAMANVFGIQANAELRLPSGWYASADLSYQKGEEELDEGRVSASRHAAPTYGIGRLGYRNKRLSLELNAPFQAERSHKNLAIEEQGKTEIYALDTEGNTYAPSWIILNFKSMIQLNESFRLGAGLENITDRRYRPYSSGISGAGRNFVMSLNMTF